MASGDISKIAKKAMKIISLARITAYGKATDITTEQNTNININCSSHQLLSYDSNDWIDARVVAHFEPTPQWKGEEFGFDIFCRYNNTVGKYYAKDNRKLILTGDHEDDYIFKPNNGLPDHQGDFRLLIMEYNIKEIIKQNVVQPNGYPVPWVSLMRNKTAKLRVRVIVDEPADLLKFDDNDNFRFTPSEFNGSASATCEVTIECLKDFSADQKIVLRSYRKNLITNMDDTRIAGRVNIWSNHEVFPQDILLVQVNVDGSVPQINQDEKEILNKLLNWACIVPNIEEIPLDFQNLKIFKDSFLRDDNGVKKLVRASDMTLAEGKKDYQPENPPTQGINRMCMEDLIKGIIAKLHPHYQNYLQVYYFSLDSASDTLEGYYEHGSESIVIFKTHRSPTLAHEILHSFGLQHTFCNSGSGHYMNARFTYPYCKTDNVMDYNNGRKTYHWQWEEIRRFKHRSNAAQGAAPRPAIPVAPAVPVQPVK